MQMSIASTETREAEPQSDRFDQTKTNKARYTAEWVGAVAKTCKAFRHG